MIEHAIEKRVSADVRKCPIPSDHLIEIASAPLNLLSDKQQAAIELLLLGKSLGAVAAAIDVNPRTLYRWRQDENFREELDERRRELWKSAADRLAGLVHPSLDVLQKQLEDRYDRARYRAAATILRLADLRKVHE